MIDTLLARLIGSQPKHAPVDLIPFEGTPSALRKVVRTAPVVIIPAPAIVIVQRPLVALADFLEIGRRYHPLCRHAFVEKVQLGYYAYEQREEWRTCALAAAYAGAFGARSVERPSFSYSQAVWELSQKVGLDIGITRIVGPTGRKNNVADEMIALTDKNLWTRAGIAKWLQTAAIDA